MLRHVITQVYIQTSHLSTVNNVLMDASHVKALLLRFAILARLFNFTKIHNQNVTGVI